jgi:hypothetical protein
MMYFRQLLIFCFLLSTVFVTAQEAHSIELGVNYGTGYTSFEGDYDANPISNFQVDVHLRVPLISREDHRSRLFWMTSLRLHGADVSDVIYQFGTRYQFYETRGRWNGVNELLGLSFDVIQGEKFTVDVYGMAGLGLLSLPDISLESTGETELSYWGTQTWQSDSYFAFGGAFGLNLGYRISERFGVSLGVDVTSFHYRFWYVRAYKFNYSAVLDDLKIGFDFKDGQAHYFAARGVVGLYYRFQ